MTKTVGALANPSRPVRSLTGPSIVAWGGAWEAILGDVKNDVVRALRISAHARNAVELIEAQRIADSPCDHVVRTGCISAHAEAAYSDAVAIEGEAAPEHIHPARTLANHGVIWRPEILGVARHLLKVGIAEPRGVVRSVAIGDLSIHWVAVL